METALSKAFRESVLDKVAISNDFVVILTHFSFLLDLFLLFLTLYVNVSVYVHICGNASRNQKRASDSLELQ